MYNKIEQQIRTCSLEELHGYGFDDICAVVEYLQEHQCSVQDACLHTGSYELLSSYRADTNEFEINFDLDDGIDF